MNFLFSLLLLLHPVTRDTTKLNIGDKVELLCGIMGHIDYDIQTYHAKKGTWKGIVIAFQVDKELFQRKDSLLKLINKYKWMIFDFALSGTTDFDECYIQFYANPKIKKNRYGSKFIINTMLVPYRTKGSVKEKLRVLKDIFFTPVTFSIYDHAVSFNIKGTDNLFDHFELLKKYGLLVAKIIHTYILKDETNFDTIKVNFSFDTKPPIGFAYSVSDEIFDRY